MDPGSAGELFDEESPQIEGASELAWDPRGYVVKQERPDCALGLDYKLDLHSVGTGGQWWGVGDVIRFALGSLFGPPGRHSA